MAPASHSRYFVAYFDPAFWQAYQTLPDDAFTLAFRGQGDVPDVPFTVVDRPSRRVRYPQDSPLFRALGPREREEPMVIVLVFAEARARDAFAAGYHPKPIGIFGHSFLPGKLHADLPIGSFDYVPGQHWCPGTGTASMFSDRAAAQALMRARPLSDAWEGNKKPVNVAIIDIGLQGKRFPGANLTHGFEVDGRKPFKATARHGSMVAGNAIAFAPGAVLFDCPLLPERIGDLPAFLSTAAALYLKLFVVIASGVMSGAETPSWVLVNAWGVYDRRLDQPAGAAENYTSNPHHFFNVLVSLMDLVGVDVVFAAGNCGAFCSSLRCGPDDRGPGASIHGANALPAVLTAGAVRCDGTWLGYSSQGPGLIEAGKPDICAPSQFSENGDTSIGGGNGGTSAACGVAAGVVAGLRRRWGQRELSPGELRKVLRDTALLPLDTPEGRRRYGSGIIDVDSAVSRLTAKLPA